MDEQVLVDALVSAPIIQIGDGRQHARHLAAAIEEVGDDQLVGAAADIAQLQPPVRAKPPLPAEVVLVGVRHSQVRPRLDLARAGARLPLGVVEQRTIRGEVGPEDHRCDGVRRVEPILPISYREDVAVVRAVGGTNHACLARQSVGESECAGEIVQIRAHGQLAPTGHVDRARERLVAQPQIERESVAGLPAVAEEETVVPVAEAAIRGSERSDQPTRQPEAHVGDGIIAEIGAEYQDAPRSVRLLAVVLQSRQRESGGDLVLATGVPQSGGLAEAILGTIQRDDRERPEIG